MDGIEQNDNKNDIKNDNKNNNKDNDKIDNKNDIKQNNDQDNIVINFNKQTNSVGIQKDYVSFEALPETIEFVYEDDVYFKHLAFANQTYFEHFKDAIKYSFISLKASFFFFCHAFWPDIFIKTGSDTIHDLSKNISEKYQKRISEIMERISHEV